MTPLQRGIKKIVEENCKKGLYVEIFSPEFQKVIKQKSEEVAGIVIEDEDFLDALNIAIEEAIRVMINREVTEPCE